MFPNHGSRWRFPDWWLRLSSRDDRTPRYGYEASQPGV